ncbi:L-piperidine-6-carboxylate dehydrogenase [Psychromonas hadalis]|uniref:L-piperidine-6-carboxylate dehydrogenase n=1 Tax=Psychromonas hadalis TaxID=211669 RepID=UPI0003B6E8A3|nr:aldehyde dehydrogenase family protein [Psychromonas hadalis]
MLDINIQAVLQNLYNKQQHYGSVYIGQQTLYSKQNIDVICPIDGKKIASIGLSTAVQIEQVVAESQSAFKQWEVVPAPQRGELIRQFSVLVRNHKTDLAKMISLEAGKPIQESLGEVQELIDVCDFAVGLSRQLYGLTIATERPNHRMMEQWHPLGPIVVISAFNFPMAVWGWNVALALVCGNSVIWKPSCQCPLSALACQQLLVQALTALNYNPAISSIVFAQQQGVEQLVDNKKIKLVSATGSCQMGRAIGIRVAARMGRTLLELGGNNALIVCPSANLSLAIRAITFSALGTSGQRCTSLRRLFIHQSLHANIIEQLKTVYQTVKIGDPFNPENLMGPLVNQVAVDTMLTSIEQAIAEGGKVICGGEIITKADSGFYIRPAIVQISSDASIVQQETFAPLLYVHSFDLLEEAISAQNSVSQGLSSAIFTENLQESELFLSCIGSDCGIANVNIGTSGAEIGGAFGGEKDTGGGRESGSDAWKNYMRRVTNTINYGNDLPLAQGISFDMP